MDVPTWLPWMPSSLLLGLAPSGLKIGGARAAGIKSWYTQVFGDGLLYFYCVVMIANLFVDIAARHSMGTPAGVLEISQNEDQAVIVTGAVFLAGMSAAYYAAVHRRFADSLKSADERGDNGRGAAVWSTVCAAIVFGSIATFRGVHQLW